ncbi:ABC transporter substrate-binding protein [Halostagnicola sp. A-GB9-2]|uniref:ABC transporter substrate-binding protein n=1 Tax=Halostagnicola sp. A-GB9-2 TaxID=3048066 RepID=UPI0024C0CAB7|nr:ABC transporter substrate-binding protein [Halostagnicola sp. A-GB9-2]MDJ1432092.1 ABC transporter substrate-binding protein [Halostagnicola sp. A-GB9-2]
MANDNHWTRRTVLRSSVAVAGLGVAAGCITGDDSNGDTDGSESYSVTMEPVGTVEFDSVPETWMGNNGSWADMGIALGQDPPEGVWLTERFHTQYYDEIPGVSVDKSDMIALSESGADREVFFEHDVDVHVIDPNFLMNRYEGWDEDDIEEVEQAIAPFFGNSIFSRDYTWHEDYEYLSLYEAFEKLAEVFQEQERYEAFADLHDEFQATIDDVVPADESPEVAILWPADGDSYYPYTIDKGTSFKQWHDLGVRDALGEGGLEDFHDSRGQIDYENLLEIDPDVLLIRGREEQTAEEFQDEIVADMETHNVASSLTAVQNGDVYRGGGLYQGPITNLVLTERAAQQLYDVDEELFDRQRVSDIVNGEF